MVPDPPPGVGPLVFSGAYMYAANAPDQFSRFLVGTVWEDLNSNGRYDGGEGYPGVTVMPDLGVYYAVTSPGGGYAIPITAAGTYQVTFSGGGTGSHAASRDVRRRQRAARPRASGPRARAAPAAARGRRRPEAQRT